MANPEELRVARNTVTPRDFGVIGTTDDTSFVQQAFDYAINNGMAIDIAGFTHRVGPIVGSVAISGSPLAAWKSPTKIIGGGGQFLPKAGISSTATLFSFKNVANRVMEDLRLDGEGAVACTLDTDWDISAAPSQCCEWRHIEVRGATGTQWKAKSNNDTPFFDCIIEGRGTPYGTGNGVGIVMDASGGMVSFVQTKHYGRLDINAQQIVIDGGVFCGIKITGGDDNVLLLTGAYQYADPTSGYNLELTAGSFCYSYIAVGNRHENGKNNGRIIGGTGNMMTGPIFEGCKIFQTGGATGLELIDTGVTNPLAGEVLKLKVAGGRVNGVGLTNPASGKFLISQEGVNVGGYAKAIEVTGGKKNITLDGEQGVVKIKPDGWDPTLRTQPKVTGALANSAAQSFTYAASTEPFPIMGIVLIQARASTGPMAGYMFSKRGSSAGVVTKLHRDPDTADGVTLTMPAGSDLVFTFTNGAAAGSQTYNLAWFGLNNNS